MFEINIKLVSFKKMHLNESHSFWTPESSKI